jgi:hypothetical protein
LPPYFRLSLPLPRPFRVILIAALRRSDVIVGMGAKYQPTIRDLKASERFRNKQVSRPMITKASSDQPIKKEKKSR